MITFDENKGIFMINTVCSTYALQITEQGAVVPLHWGAQVCCFDDLPTIEEQQKVTTLAQVEPDDLREYSDWGRNSHSEPALIARYEDGTRHFKLIYKSHKIYTEDEVEILRISLKDEVFDFEAELIYKNISSYDIIERSCIIRNNGSSDVFLDRAFSANLNLPRRDSVRLTTLTGAWAGEYCINRQMIGHIRIALHSINGLSGPDYVPFFMIDDGNACENSGEVHFGTLCWSGNWQMFVEKDGYNRTTISGGISDFDFCVKLKPGEEFMCPDFVIGFAKSGFGDASRKLHEYEKHRLMCPEDAYRELPLVYNAYGTFMSQINEQKILSVIDKVADIGVELFVIDAGWNGHGDDSVYTFRHGFGDWEINKDRFPNGLGEISRKIHEKGMKFGIWMEPEAINSESELYKKHPEWVHESPGKSSTEPCRKYILNFAIDEVADYIADKIIKLIEDYDIDYFKMDCNMSIIMSYKQAGLDIYKEVWVRHVKNLYRCYNKVKSRFPHIIIENCAAGGFRADLGMLRFSGRMNRSDNQDPLDILRLHEGFSMFLLPKLAGGGCHISDVYTAHINGRQSTMKFQAYVGMMGSLAIGKNMNTITAGEEEELKEYVRLYKKIRPIVQNGFLYRLESPTEKNYAVFQYVSPDRTQSVVFAFSGAMQFARMPERIRLEGLDKERMYDCGEYGIRSGAGLMNVGLQIPLRGDMDCRIINIS